MKKQPNCAGSKPQLWVSRFVYSLLAVTMLGCGTAQTDVISIPDAFVTVIGLDGKKDSIPTAQLYDPVTGQPAVKSVLVIDRHTNQQLFVELDQMPPQSQADARYILATESPTVSDPPVAESR